MIVNHFKVSKSDFLWDKSLATLHEEFKILGVLQDLEKLINETFNITISLLAQIDVVFHTPMDIVKLIKFQLENGE